jgi:uncharacterized protein (TIGR02646 family)
MIHIDRSSIPVPGIIQDDDFNEFIRVLLREKKFKENEPYLKPLSMGLKSLYRNKCGYCETGVSDAGSFLDIDHYRPKGKPNDDDSHPGYYWLGYEWTNLVPVCQRCNRHKHTHFPIRGVRITEPPMVNGLLDWEACHVNSDIHQREKPLLLHPEADEPDKHLIFLPNGQVNAREKSSRGEATIRICKLNREPLVTERRRLINKFYEGIFISLHEFKEEKIDEEKLWDELDKIFAKIKRAQEKHRPYSRLGRFLFEEFEAFFVYYLEKDFEDEKIYARIVKEAFKRFREHGTCRKQKTKPHPPSIIH